ncbi:C40 family peptidase [Anaerotignum sp.]|nr:SH3 domain-containing protein [Anaerotignum sp.]MBQ7758002.1 SH3 domain-containing protein [Anaerotignum sp.]
MRINKAIKQFCMTAVFVALGTVTAFAANAGQASGTNVNVRAEASTSANVLGKINKGTEYNVLGKTGDWFKISYNGANGFVSADYFEVTKADANVDGSSVNLRESASTSSDSLGKFADGDYVTVTGQNDNWYRISYKGGSAYISKDYVTGDYTRYTPKFENVSSQSVESTYGVVTADTGLKLRKEASMNSTVLTVLPYGTEVDVDRVGQEWVRVVTDAGQKGYVSADYLSVRTGARTTRSSASGKGAEVVAYGKQFIGTPYVWGGTNLKTGVDCSGFVYAVYKNFGITLNRSSASMVSNGVEVSKSNLQAGDLVFFNSGGNSGICHVGIYCGDGTYVHSTDGKAYGVTVTSLSSSYSASTYVTARRVLK